MRLNAVTDGEFNPAANLPFGLRTDDFARAMQDFYDYLHAANSSLAAGGLGRLEEQLPPAGVSGLLTKMMVDGLAKYSDKLVKNQQHNGFPALIQEGMYLADKVGATTEGVDVKSTRNRHGRVDRHGGREAYHCVFVYEPPQASRSAPLITAVYLAYVRPSDFKNSPRGKLGTPTSALGPAAMERLHGNWIYRIP